MTTEEQQEKMIDETCLKQNTASGSGSILSAASAFLMSRASPFIIANTSSRIIIWFFLCLAPGWQASQATSLLVNSGDRFRSSGAVSNSSGQLA